MDREDADDLLKEMATGWSKRRQTSSSTIR